MIFDFKKSFDLIYKKNKTLTVVLVAIMSIVLFKIVSSEIFNYLTMVNFIQDKVVIHESKIDSIEKKMITHDTLSRDFVKRSSFNAYIKRKDEEYHEQIDINNTVSSKIGFLQGWFSSISDMFSPDKIDCEKVNCE